MNKTMFNDKDLKIIEEVVDKLKRDKFATVKIRGAAQDFWLNNQVNPTMQVDLTTEAWVNAVIQFLMVEGYEIKKK